MSETPLSAGVEPIAVVGMAGRFPGAPDLETFWRNLADGRESIQRFSREQLRAAGVDAALIDHPSYVPAHGALDDIEHFDAAFFGMSAREAEMMDPQHRVFLECAWEAFENAGCDPAASGDRCGVVVGVGLNSYVLRNILPRRDIAAAANFYSLFVANDKDFLPTRVSYKLDLRGPSLNVNTACSSSLAAIQVACQMLWSYQCNAALAGGVSIQTPQQMGYLHQSGGIGSADGHCRAFDAAAGGTVVGSGAGAVLLKRLADAQADGDVIHAVILGAGINNDGAGKAGFTAPSIDGQAAAIAEAAALAGVAPERFSYVEAHGTGTSLGDPIEIAALTQAFGTDRRGFCAIGSVKTNIGHLDAAAGIAGLIKTVLALQHDAIPPSLNFTQPNPKIDFASTPFYVAHTLTPWPRTRDGRVAGVSSFGIGGTNVHVVLGDAPPEPQRAAPVDRPRLFVLSAKTSSALERSALRLADYLARTDSRLDDVAWTLAVGRQRFDARLCIVASSRAELLAALRGRAGDRGVVGDGPLVNIARVWLDGGAVAWTTVFADDAPRRVSLPVTPFERTRHWIDPVAPSSSSAEASTAVVADAGERQPIDRWFYVPRWRQAPPIVSAVPYARRRWRVRPPATDRLRAWSDALTTTLADAGEAVAAEALVFVDPSFVDVFDVVRTIGVSGAPLPSLAILTTGVSDLADHDPIDPSNATLVGLARVIADEFPGASIRVIDLPSISPTAADVARLVNELTALPDAAGPAGHDVLVALRGGHRWRCTFEPVTLPQARVQPYRREGVYLITGGAGGVGAAIAEHIATSAHAHLVLTGRTALPPQHEWASMAGRGDASVLSLDLNDELAAIERLESSITRDLAIVTAEQRPGFVEAGNLVAAAYARDYFIRMGAWPAAGGSTTRAKVHAACEVTPAFARLVDHLLQALVTVGWIAITENADAGGAGAAATATIVTRDGWVRAPKGEAVLRDACAQFPGVAPIFELVRDCAESYPDALSGRVSAVSVLFPDGGRGRIVDAAAAAEEYGNHRVYRTLLAHWLKSVADRTPDRTLRILEVGGGNGILTAIAAEALQHANVEYTFTDIGRSFVTTAEKQARARGYEFMRFATFDISKDPGPQGFAPASFDVVVGLDVVHATASITDTVARLTPLVAQGGVIALVESARTFAWNDMAWGLAEGWWYFTDPERRRPNSPLLSTNGWEQALAERGFSSVHAFPRSTAARGVTDSSLVLAQVGNPTAAAPMQAAACAALERIRAHAASVTYHAADVADTEAMTRVIADTEATIGPIAGVIHAAAVEHKALITARAGDGVTKEFQPKVDGALALDRALGDRPLDFFVCCSSITAAIGGAGQAGYCAANAFLDAFARRRNAAHSRTVSIAWGRWQGIGLAKDYEAWHLARTGERLGGGMTLAEGVDALDRVLAYDIGPQVAVMTREWRPEHVGRHAVSAAAPASSISAPTEFTGSSMEHTIAAIWRELLGTSSFDATTDFQEIGGDSLIGIQVIARVREATGVQLPVHAVFDHPTIASLAARVESEFEEGEI